MPAHQFILSALYTDFVGAKWMVLMGSRNRNAGNKPKVQK